MSRPPDLGRSVPRRRVDPEPGAIPATQEATTLIRGLLTAATWIYLSREDRRQFDVAVTDQGREVFDRVWPSHLQGIQRYFSESLTDRDVTVLKRVLAKLIKTNEPLLDQAAPRQRDRVMTVAAAATLRKP